ncbi:MAG: FUSC family protein [Candidatus Phosphoribacter sp.]|nr:FUSC family protein [Actinomycetales bacterium]
MPAAAIFRDPRLEGLIERAWSRSRLSVRTRVGRLSDKSWHVAQCAIAAGLAWWIAADLLRHSMPFFAPIVAVICLGMTYGQRLRRVAEVTVGVALGVAVAEFFVGFAGSGAWQVAFVVLVSMSIALLLDAGLLLVMQSAVQSIVVTVLVPTGSQAFGRWIDAVIGGAVALVFATIVPRAPLRRPRHQAAKVARVLASLLRGAARSAQDGDVERAIDVLAAARETDPLVRELQAAADEGMAVIASTPWSRSEASSVRTIASIVEPLDRAIRSTRVLVRRVSIATHHHVVIPAAMIALVNDLADAVDVLNRAWGENRSAEFARPAFVALAESSSLIDPGEYHSTVLLAQIRSLIVDLLELSGLDHEDAVAAVPPLRSVG